MLLANKLMMMMMRIMMTMMYSVRATAAAIVCASVYTRG